MWLLEQIAEGVDRQIRPFSSGRASYWPGIRTTTTSRRDSRCGMSGAKSCQLAPPAPVDQDDRLHR